MGRRNVLCDTSLDKNKKEDRDASGDAFYAPPESQLDHQGVARRGGEKINDKIVANQILEEKSNEQLFMLDNQPSNQQHDHAHQQQFDQQHKQFKLCFKTEYHQSMPLPTRVWKILIENREHMLLLQQNNILRTFPFTIQSAAMTVTHQMTV